MINQDNFKEVYETFIKNAEERFGAPAPGCPSDAGFEIANTFREGGAHYLAIGLGFTAHKRFGAVGGPRVSEEETRRKVIEAQKDHLVSILDLMGLWEKRR